ncbi:MAG: hypothetical protein WA913_12745, partial [Pricia sp.]
MKTLTCFLIIVLCSAFTTLTDYPIDGYERTGIKRLKRLELIKSGEIKDAAILPSGAMKSYDEIELNLLARTTDSVAALMTVDQDFQKEINGLFKGLDKSYSLTLLDISDPNNVRYA